MLLLIHKIIFFFLSVCFPDVTLILEGQKYKAKFLFLLCLFGVYL